VKRYSLGLLVAGMIVVLGSCVPLAKLAFTGGQPNAGEALALSLEGEPVTLHLAETITFTPVVMIEPRPVHERFTPVIRYTLEIAAPSGKAELREAGSARMTSVPGALDGAPGSLALRLPETTLAAGDWQVRFDAGRAAPAIREAKLRLIGSGPGLIPTLLAALTLAILGWLTACLGALQWIRAEAARPVGEPATANMAAAPEERPWIVGCHLSALLGYVVPLGHLLGPMAIWLAKRNEYPGIEQTGRRVLNFQLSVTVYVLAALFLSFLLIGLVLLFLVVVFHFSVVLYAALYAQRGEDIHYPLSMKFI